MSDKLTKDAFRNAVYEGIKQVLHTDTVELGDDEEFSTTGLDSLDGMNFVLELETILDVNYGEFNLADANTINKLYAKTLELKAAD